MTRAISISHATDSTYVRVCTRATLTSTCAGNLTIGRYRGWPVLVRRVALAALSPRALLRSMATGQRSRAVEGAGRSVLPLLQVNCWIAELLTVSRGGVSYLDVREPRLEARPRVLSSIIRPLIVNSVRL